MVSKEILIEAIELIISYKMPSSTFLQRRMSIDEQEARKIIDELERLKIISEFHGNIYRTIKTDLRTAKQLIEQDNVS